MGPRVQWVCHFWSTTVTTGEECFHRVLNERLPDVNSSNGTILPSVVDPQGKILPKEPHLIVGLVLAPRTEMVRKTTQIPL